jgi:hypothetical protein
MPLPYDFAPRLAQRASLRRCHRQRLFWLALVALMATSISLPPAPTAQASEARAP